MAKMRWKSVPKCSLFLPRGSTAVQYKLSKTSWPNPDTSLSMTWKSRKRTLVRINLLKSLNFLITCLRHNTKGASKVTILTSNMLSFLFCLISTSVLPFSLLSINQSFKYHNKKKKKKDYCQTDLGTPLSYNITCINGKPDLERKYDISSIC